MSQLIRLSRLFGMSLLAGFTSTLLCLPAVRADEIAGRSEASADQAHGPRPDNEVTPQLQHDISQVLWGCFSVGADLVGAGDLPGARDTLRRCFTDDMSVTAVMPPAYSALNFQTAGGADGFVDVASQIYRQMHFVRTQHLITNIVIEKTGPHTAIARSGALAVHTYQDEHVFNATIKFVDDFKRVGGAWKITHRTMTLVSVSQAPAWAP
jgi:hypothetical protein